MLAGVIDPNYPGEIRPLVPKGDKDKIAWSSNHLGCFLVPFPVIRSMENSKTPIQAGLLMAQTPQNEGKYKWPDKENWPSEVLADSKGSMDWVVEEGNYK